MMYRFQNGQGMAGAMDPKKEAAARLAKRALLLSVIALFLSSTGYLSLIPAGIAFMLAVLSVGEEPYATGRSRLAMWVSLAALAFSYIAFVVFIVRFVIPMFQSPEMMEELNRQSLELYGVTFEELVAGFLEGLGL